MDIVPVSLICLQDTLCSKFLWNVLMLPSWLENNINSSIRKLEDNTFFRKKGGKIELRKSGNPVTLFFCIF